MKDQAMMAKTGGNFRYEKQYKKQCYHCGEYGHKRYLCPKRPENENDKREKGGSCCQIFWKMPYM